MMPLPSGRAAGLRQRREIDVGEAAIDPGEAVARIAVRMDVDDRAAGEEAVRDHLIFLLGGVELRAVDDLHPDPSARLLDQLERRALELDLAGGEHRHARAE